MEFHVTLLQDEDRVWVVECPAIPGCASQGKTKDEALENIREAIALCLEVRAKEGLPLIGETKRVEVAEPEAMTKVKEHFVVDEQGNRIDVVLAIDDYEKILEELEELEAIRAFDAAKAAADEAMPEEQAFWRSK